MSISIKDFVDNEDLEKTIEAQHAEIKSAQDLCDQRGTNIPALFSTIYKFIQNPSSVSVETFKRMIDTDDTMGSGVDFLTTCLTARLGKYKHPDREITEWMQKALKHIDGGWYNAVKDLLSATWAGYAVAEKVWENHETLGFVIKKMPAMPPTSILFEVERTGELSSDGILQYQRNWNPMALGLGTGYWGGLLGVGYGFSTATSASDGRPDPFARFGDLPFPLRIANSWSYLSIRIPKEKCVHYAYNAQGQFGNPYGRSLLRRAYKYYILKDSILQMMATALDRKGTPLTVVYASPNEMVGDAKSTPYYSGSQKGKAVGVRADQAAYEAFKNIHNDTVVVLPGKKGQIFDIDMVAQSANQDGFIEALDFCNKSIMRALLLPSLIFNTGDGSGSYSLGQEHAKTFLKILDGTLEGLEQALLQQVVRDLLAYNWPKERWADDLGEFEPTNFSDEDLERLSRIWEVAINSGVIDAGDIADVNRMRSALGFGEKSEEQQAEMNGEGGIVSSGIGADGAAIDSLQDTALNGAQVTSLVEIINNIATGIIPKQSAFHIIKAAFPSIPEEHIQAMLEPIKEGEISNANNGRDQQADTGSGNDGVTTAGE